MDVLISVIVPVYNVKNYLDKCIESILNQTYKNIEIIIVDDGSTDGSGAICDYYANNYEQVRVVHKENGGLSSARNAGIDIAYGKYIGFVDSDDYIESQMFEELLKGILKTRADISICGIFDVYDNGIRKINSSKEYTVDRVEAMRMILRAEEITVSAVNKLYRSELFDEVRFPEGKIAEDAFVCLRLLDKCEIVYVTTQQLYYYYHRENSITTKEISKKDFDIIEAYEENYKLVENKYPSLVNEARMRICWSKFYVLDKMVLSKNNSYITQKKSIIHDLRKEWLFIICNNTFKPGRKIATTLLMVSEQLYTLCVQKRLENRKVSK